MDFFELNIKLSSSKELPGGEVQKELSPPYRGEFTWEEIQEKNPRKASVLIVLYKKNNQIYFPLILRSLYEGVHSGQVGLPGGKKEEFDLRGRDTALRETREELGLEESKMEVVKKLTPLYIPPSNFYVQSYVATYEEDKFKFNTDKTEVQEVFEIDLSEFLFQTEVIQKDASASRLGQTVPAFQYHDVVIWGATAMILNEFKYLLKKCNFTDF